MIKRLLLFLVVTFFGFQLSAQSEFKPELNFGIGAGPTFSSSSLNVMNSRTTIDTKNLTQLHAGVSVRYITEKHFGLIGELNFAQMGWEDNFDDIIVEEGKEAPEYKRTLNYLEMPLLTHIYFGSDKARFFINLGPKISFLLSEKETKNKALQDYIDKNASTNIAPLLKHYGKDVENKIDYGITAGMGFELRTKFGYFTLEGRYYFGLADIFKSQKGEDFSRSANREISARLTYYTKIF